MATPMDRGVSGETDLTPAERVLRAYHPGVHHLVRPLLDAIANLMSYQPTDLDDLAKLLSSLGGGSANINVVGEIGSLVATLAQTRVVDSLPDAEKNAFSEWVTTYTTELQETAEEVMNQALYAVEAGSSQTGGAR
jgi:hypothetical protein